jgi:hypothetical protein
MSNKTSIYNLYPEKWLTADHVKAEPRRHLRTIYRARIDQVYDSINKAKKDAVILTLKEPNTGRVSSLQFILNKTQCLRMEEITGSEFIEDWIDAAIVLFPTRQRGKDTIGIDPAPPPKPPQPATQPAPQPTTEAGATTPPDMLTENYYTTIARQLDDPGINADTAEKTAVMIDAAFLPFTDEKSDQAMEAAITTYSRKRGELVGEGIPISEAHATAKARAIRAYQEAQAD